VLRRDEEAIVLVPRAARGKGGKEGGKKGFDPRTLRTLKDAPLSALGR
jgi:hypothetical protein